MEQFYIGIKALIANENGQILILRKIPKIKQKFEPYWDLPGGRIEGENPKETLAREVFEELGVKTLKILKIYDAAIANFRINGDKDGLFFVIYKCSLEKDTVLKLSEEHDQYKWIDKNEIKDHLEYMLPQDLLERLSKEKS